MKSKEQIFSQIRESSPLPSLPHLLVKLIDVCDDENVPISAIAPIVSKDTSLSSRVLRLVNSAYFGLNRTYSNLDQAIIYLGAGTIKNLAITASVQQIFKGIRKKNGFKIGHFWYHSLLCATLGKRIALAVNHTNKEEAYLAGLLHNIGHLILLVNFPKEYALILNKLAIGEDECATEEQLIGITHCEAGSWLLKNWKISPFIADAALYHHHSTEHIQEGFPIVKIIFLANRISTLEETELETGYRLGRDLFDLDTAQMQEIVEGAKEEVQEIAQSLEVDISLPSATPPHKRKNGEPHHLPADGDDIGENADTFFLKNLELARKVESNSILTGFLKDLIQTDSRDAALAATEEIIRILFECETVFFLLYDSETHRLIGSTSPANRNRELVQDLSLSAAKSTSLVFRSLEEQRLLTLFKDVEQPSNIADIQLFNLVHGKGMMYVPMFAQKEPVGVIVLNIPETLDGDLSHQQKQLQLIAGQTAISLHLDEMKRKEVQKLQTERMATASLAARKVVHEVNNPLGIISNYLKLLEIKIPDSTDIHQELHILDEEITRISNTIGQLTTFTTTTAYQAETINVNDLIGDMLKIMTPSLLAPENIHPHLSPDPQLAEIVTEKDKLKQIIINLVKNSAEAMREGGSIFITTTNRVEKDIPQGVVITLSDNGPGIPEEIQAKLFSPFMSTKKHGHSGLGLSIVHRAVQDLGGTIVCKSSRENGTRFTISLPLNLSDVEIETRG